MPPDVAHSTPNIEQARQLYQRLQQEGMDAERIQRLIEQPGKLDEILANHKLLAQYFRTAVRGLQEVTEWDFDNRTRAMASEMPGVEDYQEYYAEQRNVGPMEGQDYLPEGVFANPEQMVTEGYFTESQAKFYQKILSENLLPEIFKTMAQDPQSVANSEEEPDATVSDSPSASPTSHSTTSSSSSAGTPVTKGMGSGAMPPPPPPPPGGFPSGNPFGGAYSNVSSYITDYLRSANLGPYGDALEGLLGDVNYSNGIIMNMYSKMEQGRQQMNRLRQVMAGLDPENPQEAHQINVLKEEMLALGTELDQGMDGIHRARRLVENRQTMVKGVMDTMLQASRGIIQNMRSS